MVYTNWALIDETVSRSYFLPWIQIFFTVIPDLALLCELAIISAVIHEKHYFSTEDLEFDFVKVTPISTFFCLSSMLNFLQFSSF